MVKTATIRFSHIDGAGIVFYPRYYELLSALFAELPFASAPFAMQTTFLQSNYLGDVLDISHETDDESGQWTFTGKMGATTHFSIDSLAANESQLDALAHCPQQDSFQSEPLEIMPWASDHTGCLQVSRYYELINAAVEQWFPSSLGLSFPHLHTDLHSGIPTVALLSKCRELPVIGDQVNIWIRPARIGKKSLTYTSWLVRNNECLLETQQTIVFAKFAGQEFHSIPIPDDVRLRLVKLHVAT